LGFGSFSGRFQKQGSVGGPSSLINSRGFFVIISGQDILDTRGEGVPILGFAFQGRKSIACLVYRVVSHGEEENLSR
jgi:hypothetical protein